MEYILGGLIVVLIIAYMVLSSRINSNQDKMEQKYEKLYSEHRTHSFDISDIRRGLYNVQTSLRSNEDKWAKTFSKDTVVNSCKPTAANTKTTTSKTSTKTSRDSRSSAYSKNSSDDSFSSTIAAATMAVYQTSPSTTESSRAESCSSPSYSDSSSSSSSSSSCSDSSSSF